MRYWAVLKQTCEGVRSKYLFTSRSKADNCAEYLNSIESKEYDKNGKPFLREYPYTYYYVDYISTIYEDNNEEQYNFIKKYKYSFSIFINDDNKIYDIVPTGTTEHIIGTKEFFEELEMVHLYNHPIINDKNETIISGYIISSLSPGDREYTYKEREKMIREEYEKMKEEIINER